jgi:hypothetical protein
MSALPAPPSGAAAAVRRAGLGLHPQLSLP